MKNKRLAMWCICAGLSAFLPMLFKVSLDAVFDALLPMCALGILCAITCQHRKRVIWAALGILILCYQAFNLFETYSLWYPKDELWNNIIRVITANPIIIPLLCINVLFLFSFRRNVANILILFVSIIAIEYEMGWIPLNCIVYGHEFEIPLMIYPLHRALLLALYAASAYRNMHLNLYCDLKDKGVYMKKSKMSAILLSIFLGGLGIDRFYLGYVGMGIVKLLTVGVFGILYIYDIIMICTGKLRPADGSNYEEDRTSSTTTTTVDANVDALERLAKLHEQGILTDAEFEQKKSSILSRI